MTHWHSVLSAHRTKIAETAVDLVARGRDARELYHLTTALGAALDELVKARQDIDNLKRLLAGHIEDHLTHADADTRRQS